MTSFSFDVFNPCTNRAQKPFVSKEQRSLRSLTPKPYSIWKRRYRRCMPCQSTISTQFIITIILPLIKHPPKYIRSTLYFSACKYLHHCQIDNQCNISYFTHAICPILLEIAYNKLRLISSGEKFPFFPPFLNTFPTELAIVVDFNPSRL